ncbi:hypothetical protein HJG60_011557 [Phyllostomus discolor]|uniref:Uncharacterized protein n=1 Tax=Phyllostomus discolor TaxID=89673 RepID=A0A833ZZ82_9CHIR|nr:hypothetical protein HJG60_011557 [Phyllostomus discolor]
MTFPRKWHSGRTWLRRGSQQERGDKQAFQSKGTASAKVLFRTSLHGVWQLNGKENGRSFPSSFEGKFQNLWLIEAQKQKRGMNLVCKHRYISLERHGKFPIQISHRKKPYIELKCSKYLLSFYHDEFKDEQEF